jgi:uncharacterized protein (TIGR03435 family)
MPKGHHLILLWSVAWATVGRAQVGSPEFEVISVKPTYAGPSLPHCAGNRFTDSLPLDYVIRWAYEVSRPQLKGLPEWASDSSRRYAIEARAPIPLDEETCKAMVQSLFATRFKMVSHSEQRQMRAYALVVTRNGPKLRQSGPQDIAMINGARFWSGTKVAGGATMKRLATALAGLPQVASPVIDETGLIGNYAFTLTYSVAEEDALHTIWTALEEQLGLKLRAISTSIRVLVIDHIEKPIPN